MRIIILSVLASIVFQLAPAVGFCDDRNNVDFSTENNIPMRMIGIVILTHLQLGIQLKNVSELIVGQQDGIETIGYYDGDDLTERRNALLSSMDMVDTGCGVLILVDFFGGTPSSLAMSVLVPGRVEVLSGINLPMLIKAISVRQSCSLAETIRAAEEAGRKNIINDFELLKKK